MTERKVISRQEARVLGLLRYFTGKPCLRGHIAERYTKRKVCFACQKEDHKKERVLYPEKRRERDKKSERIRRKQDPASFNKRSNKYYHSHKEKSRAAHKKWLKENAAAVKEQSKRYRQERYEKEAEKVRELRRKNYWKNRERILAWNRKKYRANPGIWMHSARNRRARARGASGSHTVEQLQDLLVKQHYKCAICLVSIKKKRHIDHVLPLFLGGSHDISNIQLTCPTCNLSKNAADPFVFAKRIGRLL